MVVTELVVMTVIVAVVVSRDKSVLIVVSLMVELEYILVLFGISNTKSNSFIVGFICCYCNNKGRKEGRKYFV